MFKINEIISPSSQKPKKDIKTEIQQIIHNFYNNGKESGFIDVAVSESVGVDLTDPGEASESISWCQSSYGER